MKSPIDDDIFPFWAEPYKPSGGRDHLGIQNSSVQTYATLLPGLNNRTYRIRYYGFYLWLLEKYANQNPTMDPAAFSHYVRRAELLVAYLMMVNNQNEQRINGSNFVRWWIQTSSSEESLSLRDGADKGGTIKRGDIQRRYWQNLSGAFGQIFLGPFQQLRWIEKAPSAKVYGAAEGEGRILAAAFADSLHMHPDAEVAFDIHLEQGSVSKEDTAELVAFLLNEIPTSSSEWKFYKDFLLQSSELANGRKPDLLYRRQTLKLCLDSIKKQGDCKILPQIAYDRKGTGIGGAEEATDYGWYYYRLNELTHFALESILASILKVLRGIPAGQMEDEFVLGLTEETIKALPPDCALNVSKDLGGLINAWQADNLDSEKILKELNAGKTQKPRCVAYACLLLLCLVHENRTEFDKLTDLISRIGAKKPGNAMDLLSQLVTSHLQISLKEFVRRTIQFTIQLHFAVAFQKIGREQKDVLKLTREDGRIFYLRSMEPVFTSPRLANLENYLIDLGWIKSENKRSRLTEVGNKILEELS